MNNRTNIVAGQKYILRLKEHENTLKKICIRLTNVEKHEGKLVTVSRVDGRRIYIGEPDEVRRHNYYWPEECFHPTTFDFVVGEEYICDFKPDEDGPGKWYGWSDRMGTWCGETLICQKIVDDGEGARLKTPGYDGYYTYAKEWVRPVSWDKIVRVVKRNIFNFWPGNK